MPWVESGVRADALNLNAAVDCYGNIWVDGYRVYYADYLGQEAAAAQAKAQAAAQAAAEAEQAAAAQAAQAAQAATVTSGYRTCASMRKVYPDGISVSRKAADRAVRSGQFRPAVRPKAYEGSNKALDRDKDGSMCERARP